MKTVKTFVMVTAYLGSLTLALAQGSLTPPGAPAPTMKTLDQLDAKLESRTPISSLPFTVSSPGSYYVVSNLSLSVGAGITVSASHVTIDLGGFTLSGAGASAGMGISLSANTTNLYVFNGTLSGWHSAGISGFQAVNTRVEKVRFQNCEFAVDMGNNAQVEDCQAMTTFSSNSGMRLSTNCVVRNCLVSGYPFGISTSDGCSIIGSTVANSTSVGINAGPYSIIKDCYIYSSHFAGLQVSSNSIVIGNLFTRNGNSGVDAAIVAPGGGTRLENNHVRNNTGAGIAVSGTGNVVIHNSSSGNGGANYSPSSGAGIGPIQDPSTATSPFANF